MHHWTRIALMGGVVAGWAAFGLSALQAQDLNAYWKDSFRLETEDKSVKLRIGGRMHNDWAWVDQDRENEMLVGNFEDNTEMRRARIYLSGDLAQGMFFKFQYDFAGGDADFKDVYVGLKDLGALGKLLIGQFKEPFGLEELTSSNQITFMERSLANTFMPSRSTGAMFTNTALEGDVVQWGVGVFRDSNDFGDQQANGEYAWTGRVTAVPLYEDEGNTLVHVGVNYSLRSTDDVRLRARPESHDAPRYVDTGAIPDGDEVHLGGIEAAAVFGPLALQGEYTMAKVDSDMISDVDFHAHYFQASYWITGETRPYDKKKGAFKFTKPARNFREDGGLGAWQVAVRYSGIDLDDGAIRGGELNDLTLGVNWHLNPNARVMVNYVLADLDVGGPSPNGDTDSIFQLRFQLHF